MFQDVFPYTFASGNARHSDNVLILQLQLEVERKEG